MMMYVPPLPRLFWDETHALPSSPSMAFGPTKLSQIEVTNVLAPFPGVA
jgi:hypothetical protein